MIYYEIVKEMVAYNMTDGELVQIGKSTYGGLSGFDIASAIESANDELESFVVEIMKHEDIDKTVITKRIWKEDNDLVSLNRTGGLQVADVTYCYYNYIFVWKIGIRRKER